MAGPDEQQAPEPPGPRVPDLIEQYRVRRHAWLLQADELSRLRDEVRGAAEREAMEIVAAARRDVRRIAMEARRELLVLSAQVQATLGEGPTPSASTPLPGGNTDQTNANENTSLAAEQEKGVVPNAGVRSVLEEARAHITALVEEARTALVVEPSRGIVNAPAPAPPLVPARPEVRPLFPPVPSVLSPPFYQRVRPGVFVPLVVGAAAAVLLSTLWVLNRPSKPEPEPAPVGASARKSGAPVPATAATVAPLVNGPDAAVTGEPVLVSVLIEARRPAWIRAIVDGRADFGRTLEAGAKYEVRGSRVSLRVGDAGAVMVSVNRGEPRPLGADGQVANRLYTLEQSAPSGGKQEQGPAQLAAAAAAPRAPLAAVLSAPQAPADSSAATTFQRTARPQDTSPPTSVGGPSLESTLVNAAQMWLDAYHRQDRASLAAQSTENMVVADERSPQDRFPSGVGSVRRTLDRVKIDAAADTAVLTGTMTERAGGLERVSPVSQVWVMRGGVWRLWQAHLVSETTLNQIPR